MKTDVEVVVEQVVNVYEIMRSWIHDGDKGDCHEECKGHYNAVCTMSLLIHSLEKQHPDILTPMLDEKFPERYKSK